MNKIFEQMNEELEEVCQNLDRLSDEKFLFDNPNYFERWQRQQIDDPPLQ
jgi:hypothetical protein